MIKRRVEGYVNRLETLEAVERGQAEPVYLPCSELKRHRLKLGLTQPSLGLLASTYDLLTEQGYSYPEIVAHLLSLKNNLARLDTTHLSKFERGTLQPWPNLKF